MGMKEFGEAEIDIPGKEPKKKGFTPTRRGKKSPVVRIKERKKKNAMRILPRMSPAGHKRESRMHSNPKP